MPKRPEPPREQTTWRNVKTDHLYTVLLNGVHTETGEEVVVYVDQRAQVWVRPLGLFLERFRPYRRPAPADGAASAQNRKRSEQQRHRH